VDGNIREIEKERGQAYGRLNALVTGLATSQDKLAQETGNLVRALRAPRAWPLGRNPAQTRGRVAGMVEHCDFVQQETLETPDGRLRPDLIVSLPNGHHVVVDAKVRWKPTWPRWMRPPTRSFDASICAGTPTKCARMC